MQSFPLSAVFPAVERVMKPHRAALHQSIRTLIGAVPLCWIVALKIGFSESCCVFDDDGVSCTTRYDPPRLKNVCQHCLGPALRGDEMTIRALNTGSAVAMLSSIEYSAPVSIPFHHPRQLLVSTCPVRNLRFRLFFLKGCLARVPCRKIDR